MTERIAAMTVPSTGIRINQALAALAVAAPLAYLLLLAFRPYPGDVVLKTSMCVLLAALALRGGAKLLATALLFSAAGDAFLAIDGQRWFVPGLASFLITHVLYCVLFVRTARHSPAPLTAVRKAVMVLLPLFAVTFASVLWPNLGSLAAPVAVYMLAIVIMAVLSLRLAPWAIAAGAASFVASDSLLALGKFMLDAAWLSPAVWVTYALAQLLIVYGLLANPPAPVPDHSFRTNG